jgi:hypothetical protein
MRPIPIGLCIAAFLAIAGCIRHEYDGDIAVVPGSMELSVATMDESNPEPALLFTAELPIDDMAKKRGTKVFAKRDLVLRSSPSDSARESFRVRRGTPMYASRTANPNWMQVQLSQGRRAFVRADQTSPAEALALAQQRLDDKSRLTPRPKSDNEADAGDGRGGTPPVRDGALVDAIENAVEAFEVLEASFDRLQAEARGFSGEVGDWPQVRDSVLTHLAEFAQALNGFSAAVNEMASHSSGMSGNARSALQSIELRQSELTTMVQSLRATLNEMVDGQDWTALAADAQAKSEEMGAAVDSIRLQLARMS